MGKRTKVVHKLIAREGLGVTVAEANYNAMNQRFCVLNNHTVQPNLSPDYILGWFKKDNAIGLMNKTGPSEGIPLKFKSFIPSFGDEYENSFKLLLRDEGERKAKGLRLKEGDVNQQEECFG